MGFLRVLRRQPKGFRHVSFQLKNTGRKLEFETKKLKKFEQLQSGVPRHVPLLPPRKDGAKYIISL